MGGRGLGGWDPDFPEDNEEVIRKVEEAERTYDERRIVIESGCAIWFILITLASTGGICSLLVTLIF